MKVLLMMMLVVCASKTAAQTEVLEKGHIEIDGSPTEAIAKAMLFMAQQGMAADTIRLKEIGVEHGCHIVVNTSKRGGFVILADREYSDVLGSRILAFSTSKKSWTNYQKNSTLKQILEYYGDCLQILKRKGSHDVAFEDMARGFSPQKPLISTNWHQNKLEAAFGDKSVSVISGCVATAESQLLGYWEYPGKMRGTVTFSIDSLSNKHFECLLDTITFNWQWLFSKKQTPADRTVKMKRLQALCGMTLCPKYGMEATSAQFDQLKYSLVNHFGYSAHMKLLWANQVETTAILLKGYQELAAKRPVPISTGGRALLLDGYRDGRFHLNFGWGGKCNGYYKLFTVKPFLSMLVDVMPEVSTEKPLERMVEVKKSGTLATLLPEAMNVGKLAVKGKLNADDWRLIRRMAGAVDSSDPSLPTGVLQELDLSQALFVESSTPYMTLPGKQARLSGHIIHTHMEKWEGREYKSAERINYDTKKMTHEMFRELEDVNMRRICGFDFEEKVPDSLYLVHFFLSSERLNTYQFIHCDNLKKVVFGRNIKGTSYNPFNNCSSLETIVLQAKDIKIHVKTFRGLKRLRTVRTYQKGLKGRVFRDSFYPKVTVEEP